MACSGPLTAEAWLQATLSTRCGGLGLRSVARHSVADYYATSLWATAPLWKDMDPGYDPDFNAALNLVNMALPPADHLPVPARQPVRQQELSRALDRVVVARLAAPAPRQEAFRAHLQLLQQEGAGAWPCSPKRRLGASHGDPALSDHGSLAASLAGV